MTLTAGSGGKFVDFTGTSEEFAQRVRDSISQTELPYKAAILKEQGQAEKLREAQNVIANLGPR